MQIQEKGKEMRLPIEKPSSIHLQSSPRAMKKFYVVVDGKIKVEDGIKWSREVRDGRDFRENEEN